MFDRVLFIGSKVSGLKVLEKIYQSSPETLVGCVTVDDSDDVRSALNSIQEYCRKNEIGLEILNGKCDLAKSVAKFSPNLCIVMGWYYIISEELLDQVRGGFIGVHNSLLPSHRGFAPVVWAIISGDEKTGFSVFSFDKGMDTGDIWFQGEVRIDKNDYISDVLDKLDKGINTFFDIHYKDILSGKLLPKKQSNVGISYGARRYPEDGVIDWNKPAHEIYNFIRAQSKPYPGAYSLYRGQKIIIWKSELFPYQIQGSPGQIGLINSETNDVVIVCGKNTGLIIKEIEQNGINVSAIRVFVSLKYKIGQ